MGNNAGDFLFVFNRRLAAARHNPSKLGFCSRLAQTFVFNRRLAADRHNPSKLGFCSRLAQTFN